MKLFKAFWRRAIDMSELGLYGGAQRNINRPEGALPGVYYNPGLYARTTVGLFEFLRERLGFEVERPHDKHERVAPMEAIRMAKQFEPCRLFFWRTCCRRSRWAGSR
ncbi:MAG: hypothetical protein ACOX8S_03800 [Christensenellales bacterium]